MKILAIDSSGMTASVALVSDDKLEAVYTVNYHKTHSETMVPMLDEIRKMTSLSLDSVDAVAVAKGPGSFTGLRIGSATAKGIALSLGIPVIGVPTLEGLAWNLWGSTGLICPMMDARRGQVYTGIYAFDADGGLEVIEDQMAVDLSEIMDRLNSLDRPATILGDAARSMREEIRALAGADIRFAPPHLMEQNAASVAACAFSYYRRGLAEPSWKHAPDYLRASSAEREREERKKAAAESLIIRHISESDLDQVEQIEKEAFSEPWSLESFRASLRSPDSIFLVSCRKGSGEVAGYAGLLRSFENADIMNIAVRMPDRRQGIGERLLKALLEEGKEQGIENFCLEVRASNTAAIALYEKNGFRKEGIRKHYYTKPAEDAVIMWRKGNR